MCTKRKIFTFLAMGTVALMVSANAHAAGTGGTPKGKPFVEIQGQIVEIEGEISTIQDQIDSLVARVDTIEERVGADEEAIASLQVQNANLQAQIDANATDIASMMDQIVLLEDENSDLQAEIDALGDADGALQAQIDTNNGLIASLQQALSDLSTSLQDQIDNNSTLIAALESEILEINALLLLKQDILDGNCPAGSSLRQIDPDGGIFCETDDTGVTGLQQGSQSTVGTALCNTCFAGPFGQIAACPSGWLVSGGGFTTSRFVITLSSNPFLSFAWAAQGRSFSMFSNPFVTHANCIRLVP